MNPTESYRPQERTGINGDSVISLGSAQSSVDVGGEVVILGSATGVYYRLDSVGARIWNILSKPTKLSALVDAIASEYEVEPKQAEADAVELLESLQSEGLIVVDNPSDSA